MIDEFGESGNRRDMIDVLARALKGLLQGGDRQQGVRLRTTSGCWCVAVESSMRYQREENVYMLKSKIMLRSN